jgi:threonine synthase
MSSAFPIEKITSRAQNMWRYREALPVCLEENAVTFCEGFTPLLEVPIGRRSALIKQDHLFPTGSYKDRGASLMISVLKEHGVKEIVEDSSGNAGCSVAAYAARAGIDCEIFVPSDTSKSKLAQIAAYGARLNLVPGSREDTAAAVLKAAASKCYASHSYNPLFFHGTKTFAFEVTEQLGWRRPDVVVLPAGNGTLLLGAYIGFNELLDAGVISSIPKIIAVQARNCSPLARSYEERLEKVSFVETQPTIAEGIAIAKPIRGNQILKAVRDSGGDFVTVEETEIDSAYREMAKMGFFIELTSAAVIAGLKKYAVLSDDAEVVVSVFTGHGLKTAGKGAS